MTRRLFTIAAILSLACASIGCGAYHAVELHGSEDAFRLVAEENHPAQLDEGVRGSMQIGGITLRQERDLSVVLVFPSGRRERVRMTPVPPSGAVIELFARMDPWRPPLPLGFVAYTHLLPAALADDVRRKKEPYATDATRVAFALLATDRVPVRGVFGTTPFYGWIRLTREEWTTLFTALAERVTPAGSSAGVVRDARLAGVGVVEGLTGRGDGTGFSPLRVTMSAQRSPEEIPRLDLTDYALVSVVAQYVPNEGRPGTRRWQVNVSPVGPATGLRGGTLLPVVLHSADSPATALLVRLGGRVQTHYGIDSGVHVDEVEVIDASRVWKRGSSNFELKRAR